MCNNKKTKKNPIVEIFNNAGFQVEGDNRQRAIRSLNSVINSGLVKISLADKGMVFTNKNWKNGQEHNLKVHAAGWVRRVYIGRDPSFLDVLTQVGSLLRNPAVKEKISSSVSLNGACYKCGGAGIIKQFYYYANGVCFDCLGSGRNDVKTDVKITQEK